MRLRGEKYSRRLREYTDSTMQLIMDIGGISKEAAVKRNEITTNSELNEEQVVEALKKLKAEHEARTPR